MVILRVLEKYYNLLKSEEKVIELRLYDEKRQKIKLNDVLNISNISNPDDNFNVLVTYLYKAENFNKLCDIINPKDAGFSSKDDLVQTMLSIYSEEQQTKYGVIGIKIQKL